MSQQVKLPAFKRTGRFMAVFTTDHSLSLTSARSIHSRPPIVSSNIYLRQCYTRLKPKTQGQSDTWAICQKDWQLKHAHTLATSSHSHTHTLTHLPCHKQPGPIPLCLVSEMQILTPGVEPRPKSDVSISYHITSPARDPVTQIV